MNEISRSGPDPQAIVHYILGTYPDTDMVEIPGAWFFSLDAEKHFPNYATIVTNDDHDANAESNLARPGVFRLNLGVDRPTFERLVGGQQDPDYSALDRVLPHPVYGRQLWLCILSPTTMTFNEVVVPLLEVAHDRLAAQRARHVRQAP
jgi:hypothetical protein